MTRLRAVSLRAMLGVELCACCGVLSVQTVAPTVFSQYWVSRNGVPMDNGASHGAVNCASFDRILGLRGGRPNPPAENGVSRGYNCGHVIPAPVVPLSSSTSA